MQTKSLTLNVTASHISDGKKSESAFCPIALALREAIHKKRIPWISTEDFRYVFVETDFVEIKVNSRVYRARTKQREQDFIRLFDAGGAKSVQPFSDTLNFSTIEDD